MSGRSPARRHPWRRRQESGMQNASSCQLGRREDDVAPVVRRVPAVGGESGAACVIRSIRPGHAILVEDDWAVVHTLCRELRLGIRKGPPVMT